MAYFTAPRPSQAAAARVMAARGLVVSEDLKLPFP